MKDALVTEFEEAVNDDLADSVKLEDRERLADHLFHWLSVTARKKPVPNLPERLELMRKRFVVLSQQAQLVFEGGEIVISVVGDAETTLIQLERGTSWFESYDGVREQIVNVLCS